MVQCFHLGGGACKCVFDIGGGGGLEKVWFGPQGVVASDLVRKRFQRAYLRQAGDDWRTEGCLHGYTGSNITSHSLINGSCIAGRASGGKMSSPQRPTFLDPQFFLFSFQS